MIHSLQQPIYRQHFNFYNNFAQMSGTNKTYSIEMKLRIVRIEFCEQ